MTLHVTAPGQQHGFCYGQCHTFATLGRVVRFLPSRWASRTFTALRGAYDSATGRRARSKNERRMSLDTWTCAEDARPASGTDEGVGDVSSKRAERVFALVGPRCIIKGTCSRAIGLVCVAEMCPAIRELLIGSWKLLLPSRLHRSASTRTESFGTVIGLAGRKITR